MNLNWIQDAGLGSVTVNEGTLIINGDATGTTGAWTVNAGATLTGSGSLGGTATIGDGATLSPGNSPGTQTFDNLTWVNGGTYLWEINADLASGGGEGVDSGWDWIDVTNTFDLSGITTGFNIDITSLTTGNIAGLADGFDYSGKSYLDPYESFTILSFGSLTGDFDASEFNLLTGNFANPKVDWSLEHDVATTLSSTPCSCPSLAQPHCSALADLPSCCAGSAANEG